MTILESLNAGTRVEGVEEEHPNLRKEEHVKEGQDACRVALVDAMAEVQALDKPDCVINCCLQLADHFISRLNDKYNRVNEVGLRKIFDRYAAPHSLKQATRSRRQGTQLPVAYHVTNTTNIAKVSMKRLLSHSQTKSELPGYLGQKILEHALAEGHRLVVAWGTQCSATFTDKSYMNSDQEEADTELILHAVYATACGATSIDICSPDTDMLILAICRYPELCKNTKRNREESPNNRNRPHLRWTWSRESSSTAISTCPR